jgi:hypothetical protein
MTSNPTPAPVPASHPVLIERTHTYLVWIQADTPAAARGAAEKDPGAFLGELAELEAVPVDASTDTALVTVDTAAWLDLDGEAYQRLDDYFAAASTGAQR